MTTKHQKILNYIEKIPVGTQLSVRQVARQMEVSEGTAYRAIKEAENDGLLLTIQRVGTIRTEPPKDPEIQSLTFTEVLNISEGTLLGGSNGLKKTLKKFVIGAMELDAMSRYITDESLVIVGNREKAQRMALEMGAAVLITGGFSTDPEIVALADERELPLISTTYDTYTVSTMINRAMTDQLIQKEILRVESIYTPLSETFYLSDADTVGDYRRLNRDSQHSRFPIINNKERIVGIVSPRDLIGKPDDLLLTKVMTRQPLTVNLSTNVANASHIMIWEGYEMLPVMGEDLTLQGVISRQDVMKAMQTVQQQVQVGDTISDQIRKAIESHSKHEFSLTVTPQMVNAAGSVSIGVLTEALAKILNDFILVGKRNQYMIDQIDLHYLKMVQIGSVLTIKPQVFDESRTSVRLDIDLYSKDELVAKALVTSQIFTQEV